MSFVFLLDINFVLLIIEDSVKHLLTYIVFLLFIFEDVHTNFILESTLKVEVKLDYGAYYFITLTEIFQAVQLIVLED